MNKRKLYVTILVVITIFIGFPSIQAQAAAKPQLNAKTVTLILGNYNEKYTLQVVNANKKPKWKSSNKKVVSVSSFGTLKPKKAGKAVVSCKVGKKVVKCNVKVIKKPKMSSVKKKLKVYSKVTGQVVKVTVRNKADYDINATVTYSVYNENWKRIDSDSADDICVKANSSATYYYNCESGGKNVETKVNSAYAISAPYGGKNGNNSVAYYCALNSSNKIVANVSNPDLGFGAVRVKYKNKTKFDMKISFTYLLYKNGKPIATSSERYIIVEPGSGSWKGYPLIELESLSGENSDSPDCSIKLNIEKVETVLYDNN